MLSQSFKDAVREAIAPLAALGQPFTYWWRDDDAVADTPALRELLELVDTTHTPLALAVIPANVESSLVEAVAACADVHVWQHGYAHQNHAPADVKKTELGDHRPVATVLGELRDGRARLRRMFGSRLEPVLVPPWNRIGESVLRELPQAGLSRVSAFGPAGVRSGDAVALANTHIDIIDWRGTRGFTGEAAALEQLEKHVAARVSGATLMAEATGWLTHHLVHDAESSAFLRDVFEFLSGLPDAQVRSPATLFDGA